MDVNGDGLRDGIAISSRWNNGALFHDLTIRSGLEAGGFSEAEVASFEVQPNDINSIGFDYLRAGDLDGDGYQDLVFGDCDRRWDRH